MTKTNFIIVLFLYLLFKPFISFAEEKDELLLFFEEKEIFVTTAAKYEQKVKESPSTITVVTRDDMERGAGRNLAEVLETVAGYDVTYNGNFRRANIGARGLLDDSQTKRVLFLIDNRPANSVGNGSFDAWFEMPLNNIERIEIIRGPGSALYGPNAFSGVINIITKSPEEKLSGDVSAVYGTGDAKGYDINLTDTIGDVGIIAAGSGLHLNDEGIWHENEKFDRDSIWAKVAYKDLILSLGYNENDKGLPQKGKYKDREFWGENYSWFLDGSYSLHATQDIDINAHLYLMDEDRRLLYSDSAKKNSANKDQFRDEQRVGGDIYADYRLTDNYRFIGGVDFREEELEYNLDRGASERHAKNSAVFLQGEALIFDSARITVGGRYDDHSVYGDKISPRLSFLYNPVEKARFKLSYGEAFRSPDFTELYLYIGSRKVGNENLKPEKVKSYEGGLGYTFSRYLDGDVTLFFNQIEDIITFDAANFRYFNQNGEGETRGVEVEIKSRPIKNIKLFANYTFQETEDATGKDIIEAPKHKFNAGVTGVYGSSTITLSMHHHGDRKDSYNNELSDYTVFNGKYIYRIKDGLNLFLIARNILDKRYIIEKHDPIYSTGYQANDYIYEGIHVWTGINISF